jgi:hypothetical protein
MAMTLLAALSGCDKPAFIDLDPKEHTFKRVGEDVWWTAKVRTRNGKFIHRDTVAWSSSDSKVVTIDDKGRAKSVGPGHATIIAKVQEVISEAAVDVQGVSKVTLEPVEGLTLEARGEGKPIVVKCYDLAGHIATDRHPIARCVNEDICRVFGEEVRGVDSGETILEATCEGQKASVSIKVTPTEEERIAKGIDVDKPKKPQKKK